MRLFFTKKALAEALGRGAEYVNRLKETKELVRVCEKCEEIIGCEERNCHGCPIINDCLIRSKEIEVQIDKIICFKCR